MAAGFGERQRAEEFARLLDSLDAAPRTGVAILDRDELSSEHADGRADSTENPGGTGRTGSTGNTGNTSNTETVADHPQRDRAGRPRIPAQRVDPEMAALLRTVEALIGEGRFRAPVMRPEFKEALGRRLQADFLHLFNADVDSRDSHGGHGSRGSHSDDGDGDGASADRSRATRHRSSSPWRRRLLGGGVAVGVLSGGISGVAWAASGALPGDPLYSVKRGLEDMRVSVSGSDLERGEQYLGQAKTRIGEIRRLLAHHEANVDGSDISTLIDTTMDSLNADVASAGQLLIPLAAGGDAEALAHLQEFVTAYGPQVHDLETLLAPGSQAKAWRLDSLMQSFQGRLTAARAAIEKAKSSQGHPSAATSPHRTGATPTTGGSGTTTTAVAASAEQQHSGSAPAAGPAGTTPAPAAPSPSPPLNVQVPLGSSDTTVVVPPLLSGLPPIGITLGTSAAPSQSGPSGPTADAGPPPTDPNPN